jgi:DNA-directed RNA polymerase specialized sigma24 family protein
MFSGKHSLLSRARNAYATSNDFQKIFTEDMAGLHLLAFLLTGNQAAAEQVFVGGLDDALHGNPVFKEWARSWSKRVIIKRAIRLAAPWDGEPAVANPQLFPQALDSERDALIRSVLRLPALERFVFVMSVLEGYSVSETAVLLGCTMRDVLAARSESVKQVNVGRWHPVAPPALVSAWQSLFNSARAA